MIDSIVKRLAKLDPQKNRSYVEARVRADEDTGGILYDMAIIDSKSSALLTHISLTHACIGDANPASRQCETLGDW